MSKLKRRSISPKKRTRLRTAARKLPPQLHSQTLASALGFARHAHAPNPIEATAGKNPSRAAPGNGKGLVRRVATHPKKKMPASAAGIVLMKPRQPRAICNLRAFCGPGGPGRIRSDCIGRIMRGR
jgi:hypothetical protein